MRPFGPGGIPGTTCLTDGNTSFKPTWAVETNYYMDLGFLPENMQYFSISGRAAWYGKKGTENNPLPPSRSRQRQHGRGVQLRTDPSDDGRLQGDVGREIFPLRRRLGRLSLLAEQVRPRPCQQHGLQRVSRREQPLLHGKLTLLGYYREVLIT